MSIRSATAQDAAGILSIYAPIVESSPASFELETPSLAEMQRRISDAGVRYPWLISESEEGDVLGYAHASPHRKRPAYAWSVEVSVYVREGSRRSGVGRALYESLKDNLTRQGYCNAYAGIVLPNPASVALHESLGFKPVGIYRGVGFKLGAWHDVGWWHYPLRDLPPTPPDLDFGREK